MKKLIFVVLWLCACGDGKDIQISNNNENSVTVDLSDAESKEAEDKGKNVCLVCQEKFFGDDLQLSACYARHPECASFAK